MRKLIAIYFLIYCGIAYGQTNLVLNPSFESYTACPSALGEIYNANDWYLFNGSPDYFNSCTSVPSLSVPSNDFGYQLSYNGNAYTGIITYYNSGLAREIIGGKLSSVLTVGQKYFISFMANRGDDGTLVGYSSNNLGVKFSKVNSYTVTNTVNVDNTSHLNNLSIITNTATWVRFAGSFVADSAYKYIMLGNFYDDSNTNITQQSAGIYAYYYLDDICVSTDSVYTYNYAMSLKEIEKNTNVLSVWPNPANNYFYVKVPSSGLVEIYNSIGEKINFQMKDYWVDCTDWPAGLYYMRYKNESKHFIKLNN
jgi:hypothetical protein